MTPTERSAVEEAIRRARMQARTDALCEAMLLVDRIQERDGLAGEALPLVAALFEESMGEVWDEAFPEGVEQ